MFFRRYGTFTGGIDLPDDKDATLDMPVETWRGPSRLRVPLTLRPGQGATPVVEPTERVVAGQLLARADSTKLLDVFAPLGGVVGSVTRVRIAGKNRFFSAPAIELTQLDTAPPLTEEPFDWRDANSADLIEHIKQGQIPQHCSDPEPLAPQLERARRSGCRIVIANGIEGQPYVTSAHRLLVESGLEVAEGLAILARALDARESIVAVDSRRTGAYRQLEAACRRLNLDRIALPAKYPIGADPMLVKMLTRREVPPGRDLLAVGALVVDPATCVAVRQWFVEGSRRLERLVTVSGPGAGRLGNYLAPIGTSCGELAGPTHGPIIHGGPMAGIESPPDSVVSYSTNTLLSLGEISPETPGACLRCGWCTDHCPARLNVSALNELFELGTLGAQPRVELLKRARRLGVQACMSCGVCSYVCPAHLPLTRRVKLQVGNLAFLKTLEAELHSD